MNRDMELIRKILITLEESEQTQGFIPLKFDGYSDEQISYHVKILAEYGIIGATDCSSLSGFAWKAKGLTWDGHDYIKAIRDETHWQEVKNWVKNTGKVLTMETLKETLKKAVTELFLCSSPKRVGRNQPIEADNVNNIKEIQCFSQEENL